VFKQFRIGVKLIAAVGTGEKREVADTVGLMIVQTFAQKMFNIKESKLNRKTHFS
jgi:hypothetical protein